MSSHAIDDSGLPRWLVCKQIVFVLRAPMTLSQESERPAVLTSWKEIARYMGKGVRTVQRWEQDFGLPVRRPKGSDKKAVLARPSDLDSWLALRCGTREECQRADSPGTRVLLMRTTLSNDIETSRQLRAQHQHVRDEITSALTVLTEQLTLICKKAG